MNAILIDPYTQTVSTVQITGNELESIYKLIGCSTFTTIELSRGDAMYVDDEGMLKLDEDTRFFVLLNAANQPVNLVSGRGLVLGTNREGDSQSPRLTAEAIAPFIKWVNDSPNAVLLADELVDMTGLVSGPEDYEAKRDQFHQIMQAAIALT